MFTDAFLATIPGFTERPDICKKFSNLPTICFPFFTVAQMQHLGITDGAALAGLVFLQQALRQQLVQGYNAPAYIATNVPFPEAPVSVATTSSQGMTTGLSSTSQSVHSTDHWVWFRKTLSVSFRLFLGV
jgi:hypothetical protein